MSRFSRISLALSLAGMAAVAVACDRTPAQSSSLDLPPIGVAFNAGVPDSTQCGIGVSWNASLLHYHEQTFWVQEEEVSTCGAIPFEGQAGLWRTFYIMDQGQHPGHWSTWRRRLRFAASGSFTDSIAQHARLDADSVQIPFALDDQFDLVGLHHHLQESSDVPPPGQGVEGWAQIWRFIGLPAIDSVKLREDGITVFFVNNSRRRVIDSTRVERRASGSAQWELRGFAVADADTFAMRTCRPAPTCTA